MAITGKVQPLAFTRLLLLVAANGARAKTSANILRNRRSPDRVITVGREIPRPATGVSIVAISPAPAASTSVRIFLTHKITVNGMCGGQKIPSGSWAAGVYVRDGNRWKAAFHVEAPIVDPTARPAKPVAENATSQELQTAPIAQDVHTDALLALEKALWEAWKDHDAKKLGRLTATNMQFINIFGTHLATKTEALKNWPGEGCNVKTVALTDAAATMLLPTVGILTFHASTEGTCFGQKVGPVWGSSVYVKDGDAWKWTFGINVPALRKG